MPAFALKGGGVSSCRGAAWQRFVVLLLLLLLLLLLALLHLLIDLLRSARRRAGAKAGAHGRVCRVIFGVRIVVAALLLLLPRLEGPRLLVRAAPGTQHDLPRRSLPLVPHHDDVVTGALQKL